MLDNVFFSYIDAIRESRKIDAADFAHKLWPDISKGAAATRYSRYKGINGKQRQRITLADADTMCEALNLNIASVIFELKEHMNLKLKQNVLHHKFCK